jgi:hypothetical protein
MGTMGVSQSEGMGITETQEGDAVFYDSVGNDRKPALHLCCLCCLCWPHTSSMCVCVF